MTGSEMNKLTVANMQVEALRKQLRDAQATVEAAISDRDKQQDISKALYQQVEALQARVQELERQLRMRSIATGPSPKAMRVEAK